MKYDVAIIGSGLGGLVCAALLVKAGRSVLVLEQGRQPGGCLQSYSRAGWRYDTGLHYIGGLDSGWPLQRAFLQLGLMDLPWKRLDEEGFDRVMIGQREFRFAQGFDRFVDVLAEDFPSQRAALGELARLLEAPVPAQLAGVGAYDYLCRLFDDPLLVNVLAGAAMKMELRRESLPLFTYVHGLASYVGGGAWRLKGDGQQVVDTLLRQIAAGGEVLCGKEVVELTAEGGRIVAARCRDGEAYDARTFVSSIHPAATCGLVRPALRGMYSRRVCALPNTNGVLTVSLRLRDGALRYFNHNGYVYTAPEVWTCQDAADRIGGVMVSARVPEDDGAFVRQIDLMAPMAWSGVEAWQNTSVGRRGADYLALKERLADECVALASRFVPQLADCVEARYVSTPLTWRDYTLTPQGSAFGIRKDYHAPLLSMLSPKTPVPNLWLTGQSLVMHGIEGVTMTAQQTCNLILNQ